MADSAIEAPRERARELVLRFGWNAAAYQILNPGIELWFSSAADGVVGFVRHRGMLVVGGAPVCDLNRLEAVAAEFVAYAHAHGERVCYFGAGERLDDRDVDDAAWSRQPVWLRFVLRWVRLYGARFYNFSGLDAFKAKFNPEEWEPIYAIAEGASFPPRALYAIAGAFSGGVPIRLVLRALLRA
ncbi:MAG TPA: hypothetical protein VF962_04285 [Gemmatimonadaceae bacterium]